jgi:hypothetical protein
LEGVENCDHCAGHRHQHTDLDQENAPVLTVDWVMAKGIVVEIVTSSGHAHDSDSRIDQHSQRHQELDQPFRHRALGRRQPVDDGVENDPRREDHPRLEPAARPVISMQLHIKPEDEDERDEQLRDDPQDGIETHVTLLTLAAGNVSAATARRCRQ